MLFSCVSLHRVSVSCGGVACVLCFSYLWSLCVCVFFFRNINNGKMMILVVAPVLQASLYLMLHGDWHTLFLIPLQTHQKNLIFVLLFCKESMQRRRDDCYPYKSVYITTWWFYNMHYHLISFCSFNFYFFLFILQSRMKIFPIITDFTVINTQIITIFRLRLHLLW